MALITKQSLGNQTRKSILYLDQHFFSAVTRNDADNIWAAPLMERIEELLDLQLVAIPYSSIHLEEADLNGDYRDALVKSIQRLSRGRKFASYWRVEETQIVKAFQAFLDSAPTAYRNEEHDALDPSVHDWDEDYVVTVFSAATDVDRKSFYNQKAFEELSKWLVPWASEARTFEEDMALEISDAARLMRESYEKKRLRLEKGDFSALLDSPISASIVELLSFVAKEKKVAPGTIAAFFQSRHFAEVPSVQLWARLFSAFKASLRLSQMPPDPRSNKTRRKYSGLLKDIRHAATYAPYCDGYFTDNDMAKLMKEPRVEVEQNFGCKVFSNATKDEFLGWLARLRTQMTPEHAEDLSWKYPKRFPFTKT